MSKQIQKEVQKFFWKCPECKSRYFSEPVTVGVRNGTLGKIHPICTNCFEKCPSGHTFGYGEKCNVCGAPRRKFNLIRHALDPDDPTFGNTATGTQNYPESTATTGGTTSVTDASAGYAYGFPVTLTENGTITKIGVNWSGTQAVNVRLGLYSAGASKPADLLATTASTAANTSAGWQGIAVTTPYYAVAGTYWIAAQISADKGIYYIAASRSYYAKAYSDFDATWSASSTQDSNAQWNMRLTFVQIKNYAYTYKFTLSENATSIDSMSFYVMAGASGHFRNAIYNDSAGVPNALQWESASIAATADAWNTHNISAGTPTSLSLTAGTYHLGYQWDDVSAGPSYTAGTAGFGQRLQQTYGAFPASWSGGTAVADEWSIYVTYSVGPTLEQIHYCWYTNDSAESPTALADEDVSIGNVASAAVLRLRIAVKVTAVTLPGTTFKLQYASTTAGPWTDVGAIGSAVIWRYYDGLGINQNVVANSFLTGTTVKEHFVESAPSQVSVDIPANDQGEWDFCIQNHGAQPLGNYVFRMVKNDDTAFATYTQYPSLTTLLPPQCAVISIILMDKETGSLLNARNISWVANLGTINPDTTVTDANGLATTIFTAGSAAGLAAVRGTFAGDATYGTSSAQQLIDIYASDPVPDSTKEFQVYIEGQELIRSTGNYKRSCDFTPQAFSITTPILNISIGGWWAVEIYRYGTIRFVGRIMKGNFKSGISPQLTVSGVDEKVMLQRRVANKTYTDEPKIIIEDLLTRYPCGVTAGTIATYGSPINLPASYENLFDALAQITKITGWKFRLNANKSLDFGPDFGTTLDITIELDKNEIGATHDYDWSKIDSKVYVVGKGEAAVLVSEASDQNTELTYGLIEEAFLEKGISEQGTLDLRAAEILNERKVTQETISVDWTDVDPQSDINPFDRVTVTDPDAVLSGEYHIYSITRDLTSAVKVSLELSNKTATIGDLFQSVRKDVKDLGVA